MTFEKYNCSEKLDNGETKAELKNYFPQIREQVEPTIPGAMGHLCQQKRLGLATHSQSCAPCNHMDSQQTPENENQRL